ncbi:MAG TPA: tripartite tricarboxylate transporter TctB family protein, partial [Sphaerochaeta sp.]|nr:tripartite tricarboxylate transporter TctB family protein [Sphaerochaeta sp.]
DSLVFALITALYIMSIALVGFVVATTLFLALSFVYLKERRKWLLLVLSLSFPLVVYVLFGMLLHVMLP